MKTCRTCQIEKPLDQMSHYWHNIKEARMYGPDCKECRSAKRRGDTAAKARDAARKRARWAADEEYRARQLDIGLLWRYGITREQYDALWESQGEACAICRRTELSSKRGWHVDHDHECCPEVARSCGACVRGILCTGCNTALGGFQDNPDHLFAAWGYLSGATTRSVLA